MCCPRAVRVVPRTSRINQFLTLCLAWTQDFWLGDFGNCAIGEEPSKQVLGPGYVWLLPRLSSPTMEMMSVWIYSASSIALAQFLRHFKIPKEQEGWRTAIPALLLLCLSRTKWNKGRIGAEQSFRNACSSDFYRLCGVFPLWWFVGGGFYPLFLSQYCRLLKQGCQWESFHDWYWCSPLSTASRFNYHHFYWRL